MSGISGKSNVGLVFTDPYLHPFSLKHAFGRRWKITLDESLQQEKPENRIGYEGWYERVPTACGGFIGLFQDQPTVVLQFYTPTQRKTCRRLADHFKDTPGVRLEDHFDGYEAVLYLPPELFDQVAKAVGGRKRRTLSVTEKENLARVGKATRFSALIHGSNSSYKYQDERDQPR